MKKTNNTEETTNQKVSPSELRARLTFLEPVLGTSTANENVYMDYFATKAPDPVTVEDEIEALGIEGAAEKGMTIFPKLQDGTPFLYDYQIKGFFKGACGFLRDVKGTESAALKAYKKKIDGLIFVSPRCIPFTNAAGIDICQRPLRAQTMQGERVALAMSEQVPAGAQVEFTVKCLNSEYEKSVREWLDYGELSGIGQWRNSGKGRYLWDELDADGNVIGGNHRDRTAGK